MVTKKYSLDQMKDMLKITEGGLWTAFHDMTLEEIKTEIRESHRGTPNDQLARSVWEWCRDRAHSLSKTADVGD